MNTAPNSKMEKIINKKTGIANCKPKNPPARAIKSIVSELAYKPGGIQPYVECIQKEMLTWVVMSYEASASVVDR